MPPSPQIPDARRGFTMVALMVGITVMLVMIAAVLPLASTQAQRDKEDELIFRGLQYAEGIRIFRKRFGRYPTSLKEMIDVKPRSIRKLWKDPITNSDEWGIISLAGAPVPGQPGSGLPGGRGSGSGFGGSGTGFGGRGSGTGSGSSSGGGGSFGSSFGGGGSRPAPTPSGGSEIPDFGGPASGMRSGAPGQMGQPGVPGPVMGVYSLSQKKAIRLYEGRDVYSEWRFTEQSIVGGGGAGKAQDAGPGFGGGRPPGPGLPTPVPRR